MSRLDMDAYRAHTDRPASETSHPIVVIGAGLAGAVAARLLADHGFDVVVLDKVAVWAVDVATSVGRRRGHAQMRDTSTIGLNG